LVVLAGFHMPLSRMIRLKSDFISRQVRVISNRRSLPK
jgi:hypothetical protein